MANNGRYLSLTGGIPQEEIAIATSAGAGDAAKMIKLDGTGRIDPSMMPVGTDIATLTVVTSEAVAAGDMINLWNSTGLKARKADATSAGKEAHGFVLSAFGSGASALVYFDGIVSGLTGMTIGARQFLATTAGARTETAPSTSGNVDQVLGVAVSATQMSFRPMTPILVA